MKPLATASPAEASTDRAGQAEALALEHFLPYRLSVMTNKVSRALAQVYEQRFRLSVPQWRVMAVLARFPDISANEVAEKTAMDKVRVSRAVAGLLAAGRLDRTLHEADRRRSLLRLSAQGETIYRQIVPIALNYEARLLEALTQEEYAVLDRAIERLAAEARRFAAER